MRKLKLYLGTSVRNFFFADDASEKRDITKRFFDSVQEESYGIYISEVVIREINNAKFGIEKTRSIRRQNIFQ